MFYKYLRECGVSEQHIFDFKGGISLVRKKANRIALNLLSKGYGYYGALTRRINKVL